MIKKTVLTISTAILLSSCATVWHNPEGRVRALTVARNVYVADCSDCNTLVVDTTESQSFAFVGVFGSFFEAISSIFQAILPRGFAPSSSD